MKPQFTSFSTSVQVPDFGVGEDPRHLIKDDALTIRCTWSMAYLRSLPLPSSGSGTGGPVRGSARRVVARGVAHHAISRGESVASCRVAALPRCIPGMGGSHINTPRGSRVAATRDIVSAVPFELALPPVATIEVLKLDGSGSGSTEEA